MIESEAVMVLEKGYHDMRGASGFISRIGVLGRSDG